MSSFFHQSIRNALGSVSAASWASVLAAVPLWVWAQDSILSLYVVKGSSMEPSLHHGDVVVVRKADGIWQRYTRRGQEHSDAILERHRQVELETTHCHSSGSSRILSRPPVPVIGEVVVYQDPTEYPTQFSIKRVVGLGQQIVMMPSNRYKHNNMSKDSMGTGKDDDLAVTRVACTSVPPYSIWVEGDNVVNSMDSSNNYNAGHGPVSKKLLVGIAEYRIWPPTRVGKLGEEEDRRPDPKPYSYWPF